MEDDYKRLLDAARTLRGWETPAQIASELAIAGVPKISAQVLTNWKNRGIAEPAIVPVSKAIGCRPIWLYDGSGNMTESPGLAPDEASILDFYRHAHPDTRAVIQRMAGYAAPAPSSVALPAPASPAGEFTESDQAMMDRMRAESAAEAERLRTKQRTAQTPPGNRQA